ncbi:hypothetical protein GCM10010345_01850 [Streptomyces canarius]|uniref:Uncharacterized protein n=1 Tax=Streptomyces canarius TaxID=285453 RepID=A0ABQ3CC53_9ACTN|nr:hypothetical protein GCM10010345_01850 [Streptomyces canarius]
MLDPGGALGGVAVLGGAWEGVGYGAGSERRRGAAIGRASGVVARGLGPGRMGRVPGRRDRWAGPAGLAPRSGGPLDRTQGG